MPEAINGFHLRLEVNLLLRYSHLFILLIQFISPGRDLKISELLRFHQQSYILQAIFRIIIHHICASFLQIFHTLQIC